MEKLLFPSSSPFISFIFFHFPTYLTFFLFLKNILKKYIAMQLCNNLV